MNIAYFAPGTIHDAKWVNYFAEKDENNVVLITRHDINNKEVSQFIDSVKIYPILNSYSIRSKDNQPITNKVQETLKANNIALCHCLYAVPYSLWCVNLFTPYIITTRGSDVFQDLKTPSGPNKNIKNWAINWIIRKKLIKRFNYSRFITSTSKKQISVLNHIVKDKAKLKLIRTGVNFDKLNLTKKKDLNKDNIIRILSPRNLLPFFNIHLIIDAFSYLINKHPNLNIELHLINNFSNSKYSDKIIKKVKLLGLNKLCYFYPQLNSIEIAKLINKSNIIIMVPETDGTPSSAIESMFFEKPVILGPHDYDNDIFSSDFCWRLNNLTAEDISYNFESIIFSNEKSINEKTRKASRAVKENADFFKEISKLNELYKTIISAK